MGALVDGVWSNDGHQTTGAGGQFVRPKSSFRHWLSADGAGEAGRFPAEPGRYHLYVSYACPWAHRTLLYRTLLGLEDALSVSVVHPVNIVEGWSFEAFPGSTPDPNLGAHYLHEIYTAADPSYSGRVSVPVLWDKQRQTIVNNESADIIRMIGDCSVALGGVENPYRPPPLADEIDAINEVVYDVNNGVYRTGFAKSQEAYDAAEGKLFGALDALEARLEGRPYLLGDAVTEADWRLLPTAVRFDPVYVVHFKCSRRLYRDYPRLQRHLERLLDFPGVMETVRLDHIRDHYFRSHLHINPHGIVPAGPRMAWEASTQQTVGS